MHELAASTGHSQTPAYYDEVLGDFSFGEESGPQSAAASSVPTPTPQPMPKAAVAPPAQSEPKLARLPDPIPAETARPRSTRENCSRSGNATFCVSSALPPAHGNSYGARNLLDANDNTAWVEGSSGQGAGDFVVVEFDAPRMVRGLTLWNGYAKNPDIFGKNSRLKDVELKFSTGDSLQATLTDQTGEQRINLNRPVKTKWVQLIIRSVYPGWKYSDTALNARGRAIAFVRAPFLTLLLSALVPIPASAAEMPKGFVYLSDIDPSVEQDMRYVGADNFTGRPVPGYDAPECVLVRQAAEALKAVQADVKAQGLSLKVYDCYRPARAVAAFVAWSRTPDDPDSKAVHYPTLAKTELFPQGYIAAVSGHSRGATMDLTLVPLDAGSVQPATGGNALGPCTAPVAMREADTSIDMGTGFDCFDVKANTAVSGLSMAQKQNREMLLDAMARRGFKNYEKEWWHFTLENEPYPDTVFDFPILPR